MSVVIGIVMPRRSNDDSSCQPVTCKVMFSPFKSWSFAGYPWQLIPVPEG